MSDTIRVLIVDDLPDTRENVRKLLQFEPDVEVIGQAGRGDEAIEMAKKHKPDIVLMDINMPGVDGISASKSISQAVPTAQIIIMSVQSEADYLRRAMLAGARDFLMKPFTGDELTSAIRRVYEMRPAVVVTQAPAGGPAGSGGVTPQVAKDGKIVSVFSPKGGTGCSTVAINLGVSLSNKGYSVIVVDGSFQFGDVAVMLNLKPLASVIDITGRIDDMDTDLVSSVATTHESGLKALLAPPKPEMADLITVAQVESLLDRLREMFDVIIIDTSSDLNERTLMMLDLSHRILVVTQQNLPSLTNTSRFFDLTEELDYAPKKLMLVVNRASRKAMISVTDIAKTLKKPVLGTVPDDEQSVNQSVNRGKPLVVGQFEKKPVAEALIKLAERLLEELGLVEAVEEEDQQAKQADSSRFGRLFGRR
ncbi:MAG TPA: response regulator [Anaerolineae bacterium]|nr:response regulator [Anaerolineae bacterium]